MKAMTVMQLAILSLTLVGCTLNAAEADGAKEARVLGDTNDPCKFKDAEKGSYSKLASTQLGGCVKLRDTEDKIVRVIPAGAEQRFTSTCMVTVQRMDSRKEPCRREVPLNMKDRFMIFAAPDDTLNLIYDPSGWGSTITKRLKPVSISTQSGPKTIGYTTTVPGVEEDETLDLFFYLQHRPRKSMIEKFYEVEMFSSLESEACLAERPATGVSKEILCSADSSPRGVWKPGDVSNDSTRESGSGGGGDPPKDP